MRNNDDEFCDWVDEWHKKYPKCRKFECDKKIKVGTYCDMYICGCFVTRAEYESELFLECKTVNCRNCLRYTNEFEKCFKPRKLVYLFKDKLFNKR